MCCLCYTWDPYSLKCCLLPHTQHPSSFVAQNTGLACYIPYSPWGNNTYYARRSISIILAWNLLDAYKIGFANDTEQKEKKKKQDNILKKESKTQAESKSKHKVTGRKWFICTAVGGSSKALTTTTTAAAVATIIQI